MERLQAAIEKARAQRDGQAASLSSDLATAQTDTDTAAAPAVTPTRAPVAVQDAWEALTEIQLKKRSLPRNRIVTFQGGPDGAAFDLLRTRMLQQTRQNNWRRIAFVSPHSGCGKTTAVANLAFSLARQADVRTLIFDFDLRRRGLTVLLRQTPAHSMGDVLEGRVPFSDLARRYGKNVAFGFNHSSNKTASEILQSPKTGEMLDALQDMYQPDLMLFDMPPLMASDDNFGFLQNMDAALLMAAAEKTSMSQIDVAERQVADLTNVMGIVLNRCRYTDGAYGHEYGYY